MNAPDNPDLPYVDTKPVGSADFYYATNATFRFILGRLGREGWIRYLEELGRGYFAPVKTPAAAVKAWQAALPQ